MNYSFIKLLNDIKVAFQAKRLNTTIKYSKQNLDFLRYLLNRGFLSSLTRKKTILIVGLRYDLFLTSSLSGFSINSKISNQRPKKRINSTRSNLTINLTKSDHLSTLLLARFR